MGRERPQRAPPGAGLGRFEDGAVRRLDGAREGGGVIGQRSYGLRKSAARVDRARDLDNRVVVEPGQRPPVAHVEDQRRRLVARDGPHQGERHVFVPAGRQVFLVAAGQVGLVALAPAPLPGGQWIGRAGQRLVQTLLLVEQERAPLVRRRGRLAGQVVVLEVL